MKLPHPNRRERQQPHSGKVGWCRGCDRYYAQGPEKCPVCGTRNQAKGYRQKKPLPPIMEWE